MELLGLRQDPRGIQVLDTTGIRVRYLKKEETFSFEYRALLIMLFFEIYSEILVFLLRSNKM